MKNKRLGGKMYVNTYYIYKYKNNHNQQVNKKEKYARFSDLKNKQTKNIFIRNVIV